MFAAVKIVHDFSGTNPDRVDVHGLMYVSSDKNECIKYYRHNSEKFSEMSGCFYGALVKFSPKNFPESMRYQKFFSNLQYCPSVESEKLATKIIQRF